MKYKYSSPMGFRNELYKHIPSHKELKQMSGELFIWRLRARLNEILF